MRTVPYGSHGDQCSQNVFPRLRLFGEGWNQAVPGERRAMVATVRISARSSRGTVRAKTARGESMDPLPDIAKLISDLGGLGDSVTALSGQLDEWLKIERLRAIDVLLCTPEDLPEGLRTGLNEFRVSVIDLYELYR